MEIIIFSKSLKHLDVKLATTSSQIFEIEFAKSLASFAKVNIVSFKANRIEKGKDIYRNLTLFPLDKSKKLKHSLNEIISKNKLFLDTVNTLIFFGYDYIIIKHLKSVCKKLKANIVSYTFDTHKAAIEHKRGLRRVLIDSYFKLGIKKLNSIDGIILFNEEAYKELHLRIPFLISKIGISESEISSKTYKRNRDDCFNIVYTGSLERYNGVEEMIDAIKLINTNNVTLNIYGNGTLKNDIIQKSAEDPRINYYGLITKGELENKIKKADLLINTRNVNHYVNKFAFPSKLIQYLSSGIPVMSTRVIKDKSFENIAFVIDHITPEKISEMIKFIIENPLEQKKRAELAKSYIRENFIWQGIIKDVYDFLVKVSS
ncbi:glycosyltransferase [Neobacillus mesonae]|uniref:Glycosyl transferase family 1 domain-containing protein n=1 Tax=Neobacillus mesonae TaxID=1193713 RepID=A0A3Q9QYK3_9BACI|nr:glycosyltransferase [Neobacillus mesonae]AZU64481.1 hypothetical protein CHR53_26435 [Neobacillus mesonae]